MTPHNTEEIELFRKLSKKQKRYKNLIYSVLIPFEMVKVELQGVEPWSKHTRHKLSTCLFSYYLSGNSRNLANQL